MSTRLVNLSEIPNGYSNGEILPSVRGKITKLFNRKTGEGQYGPWAMQAGDFQGDGVTIPICFFDRDDMKSFQGREVIITCGQGDKGPIGLLVDDNDYKGKVTRRIKVQSQADVATGAPAQNNPQQSAPAQQTHQQPAQTATQPHNGGSQRPAPGSPHDIANVKRAIMQNGNLRLLIAVYMENVFAPAFKDQTGKDLDEARKGGWVTSIAIAVENKGMGALMPETPMFFKSSQPPTPPPETPLTQPGSW